MKFIFEAEERGSDIQIERKLRLDSDVLESGSVVVVENVLWLPDIRVREITVESDDVFVYSIRAWEKASCPWSEYQPETDIRHAKEFWATGMTLTEWLADGTLDAGSGNAFSTPIWCWVSVPSRVSGSLPHKPTMATLAKFSLRCVDET
ncbi:hypothetical protein [Aeromicrobium duanguangcaii]|uniref:hypothetical protein n=1 Tax=Aeromicrobium duanguangcaii TaxID=2968086 RepID=UPI00201762A5|nr:hypothetical protein [Aeromicrobium duanguangcaii]MCL3838369.1 hypothetical protein [Aeromicrobium duanguangcaii]